MSVSVNFGETPEPGLANPLFQSHIPVVQTGVFQRPDYCVTKDGQRFLVNTPLSDTEPFTVVLNWTAALNR